MSALDRLRAWLTRPPRCTWRRPIVGRCIWPPHAGNVHRPEHRSADRDWIPSSTHPECDHMRGYCSEPLPGEEL